jgi:predicted dehydrogenase
VERFNPAVQAVKKATEGQTIRTIQIVRVGPFPPRMSNVGVVIDLSVHDIDIIRTIAQSEIIDVQAQIAATRSVREDTALLQFRTENNVIAQISTNWITPFKARRLEVATDKRYIIADLMTRQVMEYFDYEEGGSYRARSVPVMAGEPLREELLAFMHAIRTDSTPAVTGEDGLQNLKVALKCLQVGSRPELE